MIARSPGPTPAQRRLRAALGELVAAFDLGTGHAGRAEEGFAEAAAQWAAVPAPDDEDDASPRRGSREAEVTLTDHADAAWGRAAMAALAQGAFDRARDHLRRREAADPVLDNLVQLADPDRPLPGEPLPDRWTRTRGTLLRQVLAGEAPAPAADAPDRIDASDWLLMGWRLPDHPAPPWSPVLPSRAPYRMGQLWPWTTGPFAGTPEATHAAALLEALREPLQRPAIAILARALNTL